MKLLYRCCAGLDIHRDTVSACIRKRVRGQAEARLEQQVFGTFTQELERLRALAEAAQGAAGSDGINGAILARGVDGAGTRVRSPAGPGAVHAGSARAQVGSVGCTSHRHVCWQTI